MAEGPSLDFRAERHEHTPAADRLPVGQKLIAGLGGITETLSSLAIRQLATPVLNLAFGLNPAAIGFALAVPSLWDAFLCPVIGSLSDRTRSAFGRRRPWMLAGAIAAGVTFPMVWWFPPGMGGSHYLWRFLVASLIFYTAASCYVVPWEAFLVEMSGDYNERTRVQAYRSFLATFGALCLPWLFAACQANLPGSLATRVFWVGLATGGLLGLCGITTAVFTRDRSSYIPLREKTVPLWSGLRTAAGNRPFVITVALMLLYGPGLAISEGLGLYVNIFYVFRGEVIPASIIQGYQGTLIYAAKFLWIPVVTALATRIGKRRALLFCFGFSLASDFLKWFCYTPNSPWLQLAVPLVQSVGMAPAWVIMASMLADTIDLDEARCGLRRAGLFLAVSQWLRKTGSTVALTLSGLTLAATGFEVSHGRTQSPGTLIAMRVLLGAVPAICTVLAIALLRFYPITEAAAHRTRRELAARRESLAGLAGLQSAQ